MIRTKPNQVNADVVFRRGLAIQRESCYPSRSLAVLVPEMNDGQLTTLLRDRLCMEALPFSKVTGQPFLIRELVEKIESLRGDAS